MPLSESAVVSLDPTRPFRILQLTDFHTDTGEEKTEQTFIAVEHMIAASHPDLLAITGDLWCSDDRPDLAPVLMNRDLAFLGDLGVPWFFAWGNHDYTASMAEALDQIARTPGAVCATVNGRGGYRIALQATGEATPRWDIFVANSGSAWHLPGDLDWIAGEAQALRGVRGVSVPAIAFFHIPLGAYKAAMLDGRAQGVALEEVLCTGDEENMGARLIKDAGCIRACFCGHSHRNDFHFEEDGVTFAHGRSTGYGGYGDDVPKGGKLITLSPAGTVEFETIFPAG
jgi:hypothetical protein